MNGLQLRDYQRTTGSRYDETFVDGGGRKLMATDGYEWMEAGRQHGWRDLASWGDPGYDLGSWPYVCFMVRGPSVHAKGDGEPGPFEFVVHVEGDLTYYAFPTNELRREALTYLFVWYAVHGSFAEDYAKGWDPEDESTWPADIRGPYGYLKEAA